MIDNSYKDRKAVIAHHFEAIRSQDRGERTKEFGDLLTHLEIELMKDLQRLNNGEALYEIIPEPVETNYEQLKQTTNG